MLILFFTENKFGFHKIVLVCDIENIRNLFYSKYGANVDFSGYIDKFYSREIYYFDNKEAIHTTLLEKLLETWLEPLHQLNENNPPIEEICKYIDQKLNMARDFPRESKLFANEILQGAPHVLPELQGSLKDLVNEKAKIISNWSKQGKISNVDPHHLFFSIWATTQHYADFDIQVRSVLSDKNIDPFETAAPFLKKMFSTMLKT